MSAHENDQEFLDRIETRVIYAMFSGCEIDDQLHNKKYDTGSWSTPLRADEVCRLLDMAKRSADAQAQQSQGEQK
jgi:hypothetical protein